jgi:hypothetical protein
VPIYASAAVRLSVPGTGMRLWELISLTRLYELNWLEDFSLADLPLSEYFYLHVALCRCP